MDLIPCRFHTPNKRINGYKREPGEGKVVFKSAAAAAEIPEHHLFE